MNTPDSKQFSLGAIFLITLMIAALFGLSSQFGMQGLAFGFDLCVIFWTVASFSRLNTLRPFSNRRLTITEIGVLIAICLVLHGLAQPAVQSGPHPRRTNIPPTAVPATGTAVGAPAVGATNTLENTR